MVESAKSMDGEMTHSVAVQLPPETNFALKVETMNFKRKCWRTSAARPKSLGFRVWNRHRGARG